MSAIDSSHDCLPFINWICPLIIMQMPILHNIHLILIHQILQMHSQISSLLVPFQVGGVECAVRSNNDPLNVRIVSRFAKIVFYEVILFRAIVVGMFRGEMHEMHLSVVEGEVEVCLMGEGSWKDVSVEVGSEVVVCLVVANSRHEGSVGCEFLGQLSEQIPNRCALATALTVHSSVCDISSQKNQTKRRYKVILCYFVDNKCSKGRKCSHIPKDSDVHLFQSLILERRSRKVFDVGEGPCLSVTNSIVIALQWIQIIHCGHIYSALETSNLAYVIGMVGSVCNILEHAGNASIFHNGFIVMLRVGDPNNLHLCLFACQSQVYLLMSRIVSDFYLSKTDKFLECDELIAIGIKEVENGLAICRIYAVSWLHEIEVSDQVINVRGAIFVRIVGGFPKAFEAVVANFCIGQHAEAEDQESHQGCFHQLFIAKQSYQCSIKVKSGKRSFQTSHQQKTRIFLIVLQFQHVFQYI